MVVPEAVPAGFVVVPVVVAARGVVAGLAVPVVVAATGGIGMVSSVAGGAVGGPTGM